MRVMLDTNILISSFIFKSKTINELINELSKKHEIIICSYVIEELKELIKSKFLVKEEKLDEFLKDFSYELVYSPINIKKDLFKIRDDDDYIILYTAILEDVDVFITGDKDFFEIKIEKPEIMTATQFLSKYKK